MKTKKILLIFLAIFLVSGCAGYRSAILSPTPNGGIAHSDSNFSLIQPSIGPTSMAQAKLLTAMADSLRNGKGMPTSGSGEYIGVLENRSPYRSVTFFHPELGIEQIVRPRSFIFIQTKKIPRELEHRGWGDNEVHWITVKPEDGIYMGQNIKYKHWVNYY